jgi:hypothetical protein
MNQKVGMNFKRDRERSQRPIRNAPLAGQNQADSIGLHAAGTGKVEDVPAACFEFFDDKVP